MAKATLEPLSPAPGNAFLLLLLFLDPFSKQPRQEVAGVPPVRSLCGFPGAWPYSFCELSAGLGGWPEGEAP